jgi:CRP-like cAMP-binding protein
VISRLGEAQHKMASLALTDVYERVAKVMLENLEEVDDACIVAIGAERMASMVGASREMVTRVVRDMIGRGVVRRQKRTLVVLDRHGLHARRRKYGAPPTVPAGSRHVSLQRV